MTRGREALAEAARREQARIAVATVSERGEFIAATADSPESIARRHAVLKSMFDEDRSSVVVPIRRSA